MPGIHPSMILLYSRISYPYAWHSSNFISMMFLYSRISYPYAWHSSYFSSMMFLYSRIPYPNAWHSSNFSSMMFLYSRLSYPYSWHSSNFSSMVLLYLEFPIHMPGIHPTLPNSESYLCTGVAVPNQNLYITGKIYISMYSNVFIIYIEQLFTSIKKKAMQSKIIKKQLKQKLESLKDMMCMS